MTQLSDDEIARIELLSTMGCSVCGKPFGSGPGSITNVIWQRTPQKLEGFTLYCVKCGDEARREQERAKAK
jgi:hypothetical protein